MRSVHVVKIHVFDPITEEELDNLIISVDVLGEIEPVEDISTLDPHIYGIIVSHGSKKRFTPSFSRGCGYSD